MASPAFELLSQGFALRCSGQLARRQASTTSLAPEVEALRSDLRGRRMGAVWRRLNKLYDLSPTSIPADLVAASVPLLAKSYRRSLGVQRRDEDERSASKHRIRVQEEAEALYAKYRFICNYLEQKRLPPLNGKTAFAWATAFEHLGYAPAAWRLWQDRRKVAERQDVVATGSQDASIKLFARSVLIATVRHLKLYDTSEDLERIRRQVCLVPKWRLCLMLKLIQSYPGPGSSRPYLRLPS